MWSAGTARWCGPVAIDVDFKRYYGSRNRVAYQGSGAPIDHARGQMQQQIDQPRRFTAIQQVTQQLVLFRAYAGQARYGCKQGIEQCRAHRGDSVAKARCCITRMQRERNADIADYDSYIKLARHVRAFAVGESLAMTGSTRSSDGLDHRRKRLLFRCWHRGTREMDIILGRFADVNIADLSDADIDDLEHLIELPDPDLYAALSGGRPLADEYANGIFVRIKAFSDAGQQA
jgi:antitoxin CptB